MTTIALLCIKHSGYTSISQNSLNQLLDVLIRELWKSGCLPQTTKDKIKGLDEERNNFPLHFLKKDFSKWRDFFTFQQDGASRTYYFDESVQTISDETVIILPDKDARRIALKLRASRQATAKKKDGSSKTTPFLVLCDYLIKLHFDPTEEMELKQTAEQLNWCRLEAI